MKFIQENLKLKKKVEEIESHLEKIREREDGNAYQTKGKHQESDKIKSNVMYPLTYSEKGRGV